MPTREQNLKKAIQKAKDTYLEPGAEQGNQFDCIQAEIDALIAYVTAKPKPRRR